MTTSPQASLLGTEHKNTENKLEKTENKLSVVNNIIPVLYVLLAKTRFSFI